MANIDDFLQDKTIEIESDTVETAPMPEPTEEQLEQAFNLLKDIQHNNGYTAIAHTVGISREVVKELHRKMLEKVVVEEPTPNEQ